MNPLDDRERQAVAACQRGDWSGAAALYRQIIALEPARLTARDALAQVLMQLGRAADALTEVEQALALAPQAAPLHVRRASLLQHAGRTTEAVAALQTAVLWAPGDPVAQFNLGNALVRTGQFEQACQAYRAAEALAPLDADIPLNLGMALWSLGDASAARQSLLRALDLQPNHAEAWLNLGVVARGEGQPAEAQRCYQQALHCNPQSAQAYNNLAALALGGNRLDEAVLYLRRALELRPEYPLALANLGDARQALGQYAEACVAYAASLAASPSDAVRIKLALALPTIPESLEQLEQSRWQLAAGLADLQSRELTVRDPVATVGLPAFYLAYQGRNERDTQRQIADVLRRAAPLLEFVAPHCGRPTPTTGRRLRVGFVSNHLYAHTIGKLNLGLIERLDRSRFEVHVFRFAGHDDAMAQVIAAAADHAWTLPPRLAAAREQIAARELDGLLFTDVGMDALVYYLAHSRLAPVQCVTWGHPLTTGLPTIDYFISSVELEPAGAEEHYTERLVRLAHLANYYYRPPETPPGTKAAFGLRDDQHVYLCPQSLFKLHPDDDCLFGQILEQDSQATIVLIAGQQAAWTDLVQRRHRQALGPLADRIRFVPRLDQLEFQQLLAVADVMLDPLHFGGGNTSYEAFAVGTPIVTLSGPFLRSRITYALYRWMGLDDCVATDRADYVARALRLGNDANWRSQTRQGILTANHRIFENAEGVRELEAFLFGTLAR